MGPPTATMPVLSLLAQLVEARAGLHYAPRDLDRLSDRATPRALAAGFESLLDYYYFLRYDPAGSDALDALVRALVVHETYFFREADALRVLLDDLLRPALADGRRARVWSAACSTGEEPLTLAMLADERGLLDRLEIVASDLSPDALDAARRGRYGRRSLRALPPGVAGRWLDVAGDEAAVRPALRDAVAWRRVNLVDAAAVAALGPFDAILCRNVLIYFSDDTARRVVDRLAGALRPGASLLVGVSESLLRFGTSLRCEERGGVFVYTKVT